MAHIGLLDLLNNTAVLCGVYYMSITRCWTSIVRATVRPRPNWLRGSTPNVMIHADVRQRVRDATEEHDIQEADESKCLFAPCISARTGTTAGARQDSRLQERRQVSVANIEGATLNILSGPKQTKDRFTRHARCTGRLYGLSGGSKFHAANKPNRKCRNFHSIFFNMKRFSQWSQWSSICCICFQSQMFFLC